ncbi:DUF2399 domain-containing protein [Streptomyces xanthochromogenes]
MRSQPRDQGAVSNRDLWSIFLPPLGQARRGPARRGPARPGPPPRLRTEFRYHGDFDWGGLRIATTLHQHVPWQPWRYTAEEYRAAVAAAGSAPLPLTGISALSPWDPDLATALAEHGVRIDEEAVLDSLLADLG